MPRDSIAAWSLAQIADQATHFKGPEQGSLDARQFIGLYHGRLEESQAFVRTHCDGLSSDDRMTAGRTMGCVAFGMPEKESGLARWKTWNPAQGCPGLGLHRKPLTACPSR